MRRQGTCDQHSLCTISDDLRDLRRRQAMKVFGYDPGGKGANGVAIGRCQPPSQRSHPYPPWMSVSNGSSNSYPGSLQQPLELTHSVIGKRVAAVRVLLTYGFVRSTQALETA